jgi:hypothetical protein
MTAMEKSANRSGKRTAARIRAIRRKAAAWQRRTRRAVAIALIAASIAEAPTRLANAQIGQLGGAAGAGGAAGVGQGAMGSVGGLVNGAVQRLGDLEENGPGFMYYGINAADRGLGYRGSYYTVGGFIPYAEDDLGGVWNADLRGHLSNYGGFFSNVGAVRKQFWGGTLFGVGVYWDYDGDQSQYSNTTISDSSGSYTFAGGQTYNQVGVSAEWLTDYGNLRSNGYIPVGNTAQQMGPFVGNSLLCQNGINAGLSGADLEVGAYIPGLADWAGMVSVGGYAFGNARYNNVNGTDLVPYFGGVYTRMDLTLIRNWDFSLQANNDSFFDWTGFARLTYRMGGSRRRNVPDQMEQPMMRNEHVVRAHQAPVQATFVNPETGTVQPYEVFHVDNTTTTKPAGTGTWENPFTTLQQAQNAATADYNIVFVHVGQSATCPYETPADGYQFQANNQYLVGEGTSLQLCTANCGLIDVWSSTASSLYPVITNPVGPAVVLTNGATTGATVDHLQIKGAQVGITDGPGLPVDGIATVNDVRITGNGPSQTGVYIADAAGNSGTVNFTNMRLQNLTADGFFVDGQNVGNPFVNISNSTINNTSGSAIVVNGIAGNGRVRLANSTIDGSTGPGVTVSGANAIVEKTSIRNVGNYGVSVTGAPIIGGTALTTGGTSTVQVAYSTIASTIGVQGSAPNAGDVVNLTVNGNTLTSPGGGNGVNLAVNDGMINANVVSNKIFGLATTLATTGTTTTSGTATSGVSNILLTTSGTSLTNLTLKAANQNNLRAINNNATVGQQPVLTGTTPPPPNYDPAVLVPLPTP